MSQALRIIFAGTPDFSVAPLQALLNSQHDVIAVYTQPDRPAGRGRKLTASPVKQVAEENGIAVYQPESLKDVEAQQTLNSLNADIMIVVAYGLILPQVVLDMPKMGCLNIHASLLPRWRGAAPIQRAIESGDKESGVTIMQMNAGLDTGDMLYKLTTDITPDDTAQTLHDRLSVLGCEALIATLDGLQKQTITPEVQDESLVTYAEKMHKEEAEVQWNQPALKIVRKIQAFNPWPVAYTLFQDKPLRIWQARQLTAEEQQEFADMTKLPGLVLSLNKNGLIIATGDEPICVQQVQPAGKKAMSAYDFAQSRKLDGYQF
ncbi:methionyl-tRNA formyltransferase [Thiomicrorhabdus lithotrophica]|uniref:Methionyl-tRNA formyltransferase n=1 Tax=Thiomicrorhabdus lithotrophica TaxID=2949997 RepID=A0ABY8CA93_9GAMM|nr:methionyl-tRNA formyltransferase [Thiomicrorhabdus lithotrophica]WEJ62905.1 methionyl-tRNA formyltransferase [Thiomicrorhabdus lithotrophica]